MTSLKLSAEDFAPAPPASDAERIARPSLSYWEDAWQRLKQNTRALISLYIVIALAAFTLIGPLLWTIDPSQQDLNQISQAPGLPKNAILVEDRSTWSAPVDERHPEAPSGYPDTLEPSLICASSSNPLRTMSGSFGLLCKMLVATPSIAITPRQRACLI